jgi:hypothetical protein
MLRWKAFVQAEDDAFVKTLDVFTKATGVRITVTREQSSAQGGRRGQYRGGP